MHEKSTILCCVVCLRQSWHKISQYYILLHHKIKQIMVFFTTSFYYAKQHEQDTEHSCTNQLKHHGPKQRIINNGEAKKSIISIVRVRGRQKVRLQIIWESGLALETLKPLHTHETNLLCACNTWTWADPNKDSWFF